MTYNIRTANNGYVISDTWGNEYIATTLVEAARAVGEIVPDNTSVKYALGKGVSNLTRIRDLWRDGQKISAIKELRECFDPRPGLLESKQLLEELCL